MSTLYNLRPELLSSNMNSSRYGQDFPPPPPEERGVGEWGNQYFKKGPGSTNTLENNNRCDYIGRFNTPKGGGDVDDEGNF